MLQQQPLVMQQPPSQQQQQQQQQPVSWPKATTDFQRCRALFRSRPFWIAGVGLFCVLLVLSANVGKSVGAQLMRRDTTSMRRRGSPVDVADGVRAAAQNRKQRESSTSDEKTTKKSAAEIASETALGLSDSPPAFVEADVLASLRQQHAAYTPWLPFPSAISAVEFDPSVAINTDAVAAATFQSVQHGFFFNYGSGRREQLPGFSGPLAEYEASRSEMSCSPDSVFETRRRRRQISEDSRGNRKGDDTPRQWLTNAFRVVAGKDRDKFGSSSPSSAVGVLIERLRGSQTSVSGAALQVGDVVGHFFETAALKRELSRSSRKQDGASSSPSSSAAIDFLLKNYSVFMYHTSNLFAQWLPWRPRPARQVYAWNYTAGLRQLIGSVDSAMADDGDSEGGGTSVDRFLQTSADPNWRKRTSSSSDSGTGMKDRRRRNNNDNNMHRRRRRFDDESMSNDDGGGGDPGISKRRAQQLKRSHKMQQLIRRRWKEMKGEEFVEEDASAGMITKTTNSGADNNNNNTNNNNKDKTIILATTSPPSADELLSDPFLPPLVPPPSGIFGAWHDVDLENMYRLENFCIEPYRGLSGYFGGFAPATLANPSWRPYQGVDDTHASAHRDLGLYKFLQLVDDLPEPPRFLDDRPVVFFPLPAQSKLSLYHVFVRVLSLTGQLALRPFSRSNKANSSSSNTSSSSLSSTDIGMSNRSSYPDISFTDAFDSTTTTTGSSGGEGESSDMQQPLIVLLRDCDDEDPDLRSNSVMGFFLRALDIPYAFLPSHHGVRDAEYFRRSACKFSQHSVSSFFAAQEFFYSSSANRNDSAAELDDDKDSKKTKSFFERIVSESCGQTNQQQNQKQRIRPYLPLRRVATATDGMTPDRAAVCFRRGFAWQNCFGPTCGAWGATGRESYDFGNWVMPSPHRNKMLDGWRQRARNCLPFDYEAKERQRRDWQLYPTALAATTSPATIGDVDDLPLILPRVFFDLRTTHRRIRTLGLLMDQMKSELINSGFISDIVFREPWRGSRTDYLDHLRKSDVFVCMHGASCTHSSLMLDEGVMVEYTVPYHEHRPGWFEVFSGVRRHEHFLVRLMNGIRVSFSIPLQQMILYVKQASCRWLIRHKRKSLVLAAEAGPILRGLDASAAPGASTNYSKLKNMLAVSVSSISAQDIRSKLGDRKSDVVAKLSRLWDECITLDVTSQMQDMNLREHRGSTVFHLLSSLVMKMRKKKDNDVDGSNASSVDGTTTAATATTALLKFPITKVHSEYLTSRLVVLDDLDDRGGSNPEFRQVQRFQSQMASVWQPLLDFCAGDNFPRVAPVMELENQTESKNVKWFKLACLDPRVRPAPAAPPKKEQRRGKREKMSAPPLSSQRQYNTADERRAEDASCLFRGAEISSP